MSLLYLYFARSHLVMLGMLLILGGLFSKPLFCKLYLAKIFNFLNIVGLFPSIELLNAATGSLNVINLMRTRNIVQRRVHITKQNENTEKLESVG